MVVRQTEFEIKALAPPRAAVELLVRDMGAARLVRQVDQYYETVGRSLFHQGVFCRIRDDRELELKFNEDIADRLHLSCEEERHSLPLSEDSAEQLAAFFRERGLESEVSGRDVGRFLAGFGLKPWLAIVKERTVYAKAGVEVCLDEVEGLGAYVEIEVADRREVPRYTSWAESHGLVNLGVGYVELYLRVHEPATYLGGRYLLETDRRAAD